MMKIILKQAVEKLGKVGETVSVKNGYARNYLIPHGFAVEASTANMNALEHVLKAEREKLQRAQDEAIDLSNRLAKVRCAFTRKAGENERLFGSVTTMDIADSLAAQGFDIDRRKIEIEEPIKALGDTNVPIKLHPDVTAMLKVTVEAEPEASEETPA